MSDVLCRFCGGPDEEDGVPTNSGTCGGCYYGMRLDPDGWAAEMAAKGRPVEYQGGCIGVAFEGGSAIVCRDPFRPSKGKEP